METKGNLWQVIKGYFNALPDKENESETISQISSGVVFHGSNLWVLVFAILIASLGLNVNSTAVIIGAMLISPLMGPIIGMGLSVGIGDLELLKRSITNYAVATLISVLTAAAYFLITPIDDAQSELLARTSPTLYDVLIALFGGAAGILALSTKGNGNVIPGVAIATALMPPLCTAGYGIAVGNTSYFLGAFYLFFINTVFIALATYLGVRMLRFGHKSFVDPKRMRMVNRYIVGIVVLTMVPAAYMTVDIIKKSVLDNNTAKFVRNEIDNAGTYIISHGRDDDARQLDIVAVGNTIPAPDIAKAVEKMEQYSLGGYRLNVIQGPQSDSMLLSRKLNLAASAGEATNDKLLEQAASIRTLETKLDAYTRYAEMSSDIRKEVRAVCPSASTISLSKVTEASADTTATRQYVMAVVGCKGRLGSADRDRLYAWLKERVKTDSLALVTKEI